MAADRVNTGLLRQKRLFGASNLERLVGDLASLVLRLSADGKVTAGDVHLARIKVFLEQYADTQRSDFEQGA